jgi:hypothetical protein
MGAGTPEPVSALFLCVFMECLASVNPSGSLRVGWIGIDGEPGRTVAFRSVNRTEGGGASETGPSEGGVRIVT